MNMKGGGIMRIRFGYVAIAMNLPKVTSSSSVTYKYYNSILRKEEKLNKLKSVTLSNFEDLKKILTYNIKNDIHFYRLTSKLFPLATHPNVKWDYSTIFSVEMKKIGELINKSNMRVSTHPDQFNVLNSDKEEVYQNTLINLEHHYEIFKHMQLKNPKMVIHVGSAKGGKLHSVKRLVDRFITIPKHIRELILFENDDKLYTAAETLYICKKLEVPMVLDLHHYICNRDGEDIEELLPEIFKTWEKEVLPPKIHVSSPRDYPLDRKHSDYVNPNIVINFIEKSKKIDCDFDIMIEAKHKDVAMFKLVSQIKKKRSEWKWIDKTTLEI